MGLKIRKIKAAVTAFVMAAGFVPSVLGSTVANAAYGTGKNVVEYLDRGISAVNTGSGMLVSWRFLADDADNTVYRLYRDNQLVYTSNSGNATCYLDKGGKSTSSYRVDTIVGGNVVSSDECTHKSNTNYLTIPMDIPKAGSGYTYSPNDCSVGDVDGDGQYEIFVKWDPSNSQDNSKSGYTGNVYIDCYTLEGKKLWRIDLGKNIRAGAHYTQFLVADFDCDGKAEMTCKTADGTVDGKGKVIGDASKDYRNSSGYVLSGPEYYTLFDGATGAALDTVNYEHPRGDVSKWGDKYGNRVDRFLGSVMYCDGQKPSAVSVRGYYTRMTAVAYDVVNKKLVKRWAFDTGNNSSVAGYGDGNHNCMPADVDNDGKQELLLGAVCLDDNGKVLWCNNLGHGDAMHLSDFLPDRPGLEYWVCHEVQPWGVSLLDAKTGKKIFHYDHSKDTGRCAAGNIYAGNPGAEFWGAQSGNVYDGNGNTTGVVRPAQNFLVHWDGDLERELLDGNTITKIGSDKKIKTVMTADGCVSNNSTKSNPCLTADILGDWREEVVLRTSDNKSLRIYCTPSTTTHRITTLMHDTHYRMQVSAEQSGYNQPPHTSFYLGSDKPLPDRPAVTINGSGTGVVKPATDFADGSAFRFKNVNSGLYMQIADGKAENGANVQQWGDNNKAVHEIWKLYSAGDGYYYIASAAGDGGTYVLDVAGKKTANGTNIDIYQHNSGANQQFMLTRNSDGSYKIRTKISGGSSAVEIADGLTTSGANVQQWEVNGANCQDWILEPVTDPGCKMNTSVIYTFENANSGMVMDIKDEVMADATNVQQWEQNGADCQKWILKDFGKDNYYWIRSYQDNGYTLKAEGSEVGSNISVSEYSSKDSSQLFRFTKNIDGTYSIITHASKDACLVEVGNASTEFGANILQWEPTSHNCQKWNAVTEVTTTVTTTTTTTTTTTAKATTTTEKATTQPTTTTEKVTTQPTTTTEKITTKITTASAVTTKENTTTTVTTTHSPVKIVGDVNNDKSLSVADAIILQKWMAKAADIDDLSVADINNDGKINVFDVIILKRQLLK